MRICKYDPIDAVENIEGKSIYVVHGAQDSRIQVHHGEEFCDALNQSQGQKIQVVGLKIRVLHSAWRRWRGFQFEPHYVDVDSYR